MTEKSVLVSVIWNFAVFCIYGIDKYKAVHNKWRISERMLLLSAALFGGVGALFGMEFFRHKTKKPLFKILVPLFAFADVLLATYFIGYGRV